MLCLARILLVLCALRVVESWSPRRRGAETHALLTKSQRSGVVRNAHLELWLELGRSNEPSMVRMYPLIFAQGESLGTRG
jgi:hypothetical protein